jgi:hypothetical protein
LPRQKANDGKALVVVDLTEIDHKPLPTRSQLGHPSVAEILQARIEVLQAELAKVEAAAAGHRADFERERDRADKLLSEVLRATVDLITAKEATARTEGDLALVRARLRARLRPSAHTQNSRRYEPVAGGGVD